MTQLYDADALFNRSDLAGAVEALQVTFNNIVEDNPTSKDTAVNDIVHDRLWDAARNGDKQGIGYCLGVTAFWAALNNVDTPSLEMRMTDVRDFA